MSYYGDLTTLEKVREWITVGDATSTVDDNLLSSLIASTSREIEMMAHRKFAPRIETAYLDTPIRGDEVLFDDDLLDLTTFTNGNSEVITSTDYKLFPARTTPKYKIKLINGYMPQSDSYGNLTQAISVLGVWGWQRDYATAWISTGATLTTSATSGATTLTVTSGLINPGDLLKVESEYTYVSNVAIGTSADSLTVVRGANGSTAASHATSTALSVWKVDEAIEMLARTAVVAYYRLRANPIGETVMVNGSSFASQRNVKQWLLTELRTIGAVREAFG